jgi:hypothetical protein
MRSFLTRFRTPNQEQSHRHFKLEIECDVNSGRTGHVYHAMLQMKTEMGKEVCLFKMMSVIASVNCRGANVKSDSWATVKDTHTQRVCVSWVQECN